MPTTHTSVSSVDRRCDPMQAVPDEEKQRRDGDLDHQFGEGLQPQDVVGEPRREHQRGTGSEDRNRRHGSEDDQAGEQREANGHAAAERNRTRVPPVGPWRRDETVSQRNRPAQGNQRQRKQEGEKERTTERCDRGWQS